MSKVFRFSDLEKHTSENDCWILIDGNVYDVTSYLPDHPGGGSMLVNASGEDIEKQNQYIEDVNNELVQVNE